MELGCTIPLMRRERWNALPAAAERELLFCWDVHAPPLRGRLALVGTNSATRFAFVRWDWQPRGKDALVETVCRAIDESLAAANLSEAMRKTYRAAAGASCLSRTHGRRPVAFLNRMVETLLQNDGLLDLEQQAQPFLEAALNAMPCRAAEDPENSALIPAAERMARALAALSVQRKREKSMTVNEYQQLAMRTCNPALKGIDLLLNGVMGLCGEAGEAIDLVKKHLAQGHPLDKNALVKELGDVAWYLAETAAALDVPLDEVLCRNIEKLRARYPEGFETARSVHREESGE